MPYIGFISSNLLQILCDSIVQEMLYFFKGKMSSFRRWLTGWVKENKFEKLVILSSMHAHERLDIQLQG